MAVLEAVNLAYAYNQNETILNDLSVRLETGKMYVILGPSGSGKTTLLSLLGGLDQPGQGKILFNGEDISKKGLAFHRRNHVALVFQSYNLIDYMNPLENVILTTRREALPILKQLGLTSAEARRNVLKLSGGQQQRVAIARALASDAPVLLADEPTGNLDEETTSKISSILRECAHVYHKCVVVVTHNQEVAQQADCIFQLKRGALQLTEQNIELLSSSGIYTD